ncbi:peptide-methionine (R)-S-oxide reductase, partial [Candidatus Woesearchaeota archaeon]|nr:peptide-methionine (R)-S-oxide reductase [Candidatus Woesearchaeota archaeon]
YDSGTGWPCFFRAFDSSSVATESLTNKKVKKIQVKCKRCGHHLGHLYDDQKTLTGKRFCISPDRIALRD